MQKYKSNLQDAMGRALAGAQITVLTSTGATASIYSNNGASALPNPITTNQQGEFEFYAANGRYSLRIRAAGFTNELDSDVALLFDPDDYTSAVIVPISETASDALSAAQGAQSTADTATFDLAALTGTVSDLSQSFDDLSASVPTPDTIQAQQYTAFTTAGTAPAFTITTTPAYGALVAGQRMRVKFNAAGTTGSNTLNRDGVGAKNLKQYDATGAKVAAVITANLLTDVEYDGTDMVVLNPCKTPSREIIGMTLSASGGSKNFSITVGSCADAKQLGVTVANSPLGVDLSALFGAGGALDFGTVAANTWYYVYAIRPLTSPSGSGLPLASTGVPGSDGSYGGTHMPAGYGFSRFLGAALTDGSGNVIAFSMVNDRTVVWANPGNDISIGNDATGNPRTVSVPPIPCEMQLGIICSSATTGTNVTLVGDTEAYGAPSPTFKDFSVSSSYGTSLTKTVRSSTGQVRMVTSTNSGGSILIKVVSFKCLV